MKKVVIGCIAAIGIVGLIMGVLTTLYDDRPY